MGTTLEAIPPSALGRSTPEFPDSVLIAARQVSKGRSERDSGFSSSLPLDVIVYVLISALVLAAWQISRMGYFKAGDNTGYWLGVAGGVMMILLFSYPLRKHFSFARGWGRVKWWFLVHMLLGVGGPVLILLHSTFRVGSLNAGVALYSMVAVAVSGVVGRFIFARVNRGLHGEKASLRELQARAGLEEAQARSCLSFAPEVQALLLAFEQHELTARQGWLTYLRQVFVLPVQQWLVYRRCVSGLERALWPPVQREGRSRREVVQRDKYSRKLVWQYLNAVTRVAEFSAYARLFSLWHVVHIPFVYLMVISAVVHVIAVHAY